MDIRSIGTVAKAPLVRLGLPEPSPEEKEITSANPMLSQVLLGLVALAEERTPRSRSLDQAFHKIGIQVAGVVFLDPGGGFELPDDVEITLEPVSQVGVAVGFSRSDQRCGIAATVFDSIV